MSYINTRYCFMATPPVSRDEFEVALVCSLPLEYDAVSLLFDQFWDENGDQYGRAIGDLNTYTTGRFGNFDVVLVLLPNTGKVSAASATASLRSSYPGLRLVILTGICGAVPSSDAGDEIFLGDVIISKTVVQYDYGRQYPDNFLAKDTTEDSLGRPDRNIRSLVAVLETARERGRIEERAAVLLEQIQDLAAKKARRRTADIYQYPGAASDRLFKADYRHKHHSSPQCLCEKCHEYSDPVCEESRNIACDILGCDEKHVIRRRRLETNRILEQEGRSKEAQAPSVFIGRFGSGDKTLQSGEYRDWTARRYGVLAFETDGAGAWDELPCIIVKGVCNYADSHVNSRWQNFAAATAASVAKSLVERYTKTDKSAMIQTRKQFEEIMENKESRECLKDLHLTDPRDDKTRIQSTKGDLLKDSYRWILDHDDFKQWRDNPQYKLLWIKGDPGKGKTMLLCGIIDEIESSTTVNCLSYFFCQATEALLSNATAVLRGLIYMVVIQQPLLISHVREKYDSSGKKLFEDSNAWEALSKILMAILKDPRLSDVILIVDALDECIKGLPTLLDFLSHASGSSRAKWIVSSRNWPVIEENLDTAMQGVRLCLELNETSVSTAVQAYIKHQIQDLTTKKGYDTTTQQAVEQHLVSNAHGTFLWVALVCQGLADTKVKKRHTLHMLKTSYPPGLNSLYQRMLENIRDSLDADTCRQILAIISVVYRPITLAELGRLLDSHDDYENDDLPDIIGSCGSFLTIRDDVVYFIHQSAKDFLLDKASDQILASGIGYQHHIIFSRSLDVLTQTLHRDIYNLRLPGFAIEQVSPPHSDPLAPVAYSCIYWIDHFSDSKCLQALTLKEKSQSEDAMTKFFEGKYLYWLEALSLLRASASYDATIRIWNPNSDSSLLASAEKGAMRLWRVETGECPHAIVQFNSGALTQENMCERLTLLLDGDLDLNAFSSDLSLIATSWMGTRIRLWPIDVNSDVQEADAQSDMQEQGISGAAVTRIAFSHDSALVASVSGDGIVSLWCAETGRRIRELRGHSDWICSIAFSHDSLFLASASEDRTAKIWCTDTGECVQELYHGKMIHAVAFSHDSGLVASVSDDELRLWRTDTGDRVQVLDKKSGRNVGMTSVAFSHDSTFIASGSILGEIEILRVATGAQVQTLRGRPNRVTSIAFSQDSTLLAAAARGGAVRLWRVDTGECLQNTHLGVKYRWFWPVNLSFSSDHSRILTEFGSIAIDSGDAADTLVPARFLGIGLRHDDSWITWNNHNILRLPAELGARRSAISGSTVAIGCESGRVIMIGLSSEELSKKYDGVDDNGMA
ncbi:hypothetical protein MKX08_007916 [Trichoderma sp. CBMAI-0020]|nr:hypothetical protein MKX08_007916 [Trichoderma sp. CBMAI-0020]